MSNGELATSISSFKLPNLDNSSNRLPGMLYYDADQQRLVFIDNDGDEVPLAAAPNNPNRVITKSKRDLTTVTADDEEDMSFGGLVQNKKYRVTLGVKALAIPTATAQFRRLQVLVRKEAGSPGENDDLARVDFSKDNGIVNDFCVFSSGSVFEAGANEQLKTRIIIADVGPIDIDITLEELNNHATDFAFPYSP